MGAIQGAKKCGATRIIGVDLNETKFTLAQQMGATECVNPAAAVYAGKPVQEVLVEMTDGGCDYTFECIGNVTTMRAALEACHKVGREEWRVFYFGVVISSHCIVAVAVDSLGLGHVGHHWRGTVRPGDCHASFPTGHR